MSSTTSNKVAVLPALVNNKGLSHRLTPLQLALVASMLFLAACGGKNTGKDVPANGTPDSSISSLDSSKAALPSTAADSVEVVPFVQSEIPPTAKFEGKFVDGAHWKDRSGEHWLIISCTHNGVVADPDFVWNIYARCYQDDGKGLSLFWEIKELNQNIWTGPDYSPNTLEIIDIDHDGIAESSFIYIIDTDGAGPAGVKLMLHVKGKKYPIRGQLAGMDYDRGKVEEKHIDPIFKEIDPKFQAYASKKWDAFEKEYYKGWPTVSE